MQREGSWRLILIGAITLFSVFYLVPTFHYFLFISSHRPSEPEQLTAWMKKAEGLRVKAIPLGLDIQGGVDIVLEMDLNKALQNELETLRKQIYRSFNDERISASLEFEKGAEEGPALLVKVEDPSENHRAANLLESLYTGSFEKWDRQSLESTGQVRLKLKSDWLDYKQKDRIDGALKVIRDRVDGFGVTQASVSRQGNDRIRVQIPGEKDPERVVQNLVKQGRMSFHLVHKNSERLGTPGDLRAEVFENEGIVPQDKTQADLLADKVLPPGYTALPGILPGSDNPSNPGAKPKDVMWIVGKEELGGELLDNAFYAYNPADVEGNFHVVHVEFNKEGARIFRQVTRENCRHGDQPGRLLAIVLDNRVYSAPELREEITDGRAVISGHFNQQEAGDLAKVLKYGALPADLKPGQSRTVEATLGADSIAASLRALAIGSLVVAAFMIAYYGMAGVIAVVALILNVLILMAIMRLAKATLTLSGIGGILLTIGMAVDANILIYERMRDELRSGKPIRAALTAGFNRAFSVIFDSNLTTLLTALVLLQFGESSVRGFALTMTFGLIANLYTGLTVTYALCGAWLWWTGKLNVGKLAFLVSPKVPFTRLRVVSFTFSTLLSLFAVGVLIANKGPHLAIDFTGGMMAETIFTEDHAAGAIDEALSAGGVRGSRTQKFSASEEGYEALIRAPLASGDSLETRRLIDEALTNAFGAEKFTVRGYQSFTPEVGQEFSRLALVVILCSSFAIGAYLWFRFELIFGVGAVIALIHDTLVTLGLITFLGMDVSLDIVSALMILIGFSVNDTIVIYDRIRETARDPRGKSLLEIFDSSMNLSLARTIMTSMTVVFVMVCLYFLGGFSLKPFALTLVIGVIFGTYSSDFIAAPLVYEWTMRRRGGKLALAGTPAATAAARGGRPRRAGTAATP